MNDLLDVKVVDGKLTITMGVDALITLVTLGGAFDTFPDDPIVTDKKAFVQSIVDRLLYEEEDGSTPVHRMLEQAALDAVEDGCEGIE